MTLDDFKKGGSLRRFVTANGLLSKIEKDGTNENELLKKLRAAITVSGHKISKKESILDVFKTETIENLVIEERPIETIEEEPIEEIEENTIEEVEEPEEEVIEEVEEELPSVDEDENEEPEEE